MPASTNAPEPGSGHSVPQAGILQQLERILADPLFVRSARLGAFLRYVVESTLSGGAGELKEFSIGVEVFHRGSSFDPQNDNVVRVTANRLRSKLAEYYHHSGHSDPVVIDLPRGRYIPSFSPAQRRPPLAAPVVPTAADRETSVGREIEKGRIHDAFAAARGGIGSMLAISGEAGIGKTTIVEDFLALIAKAQPATWIARGSCSERLAKTDAFVPIFECLDGLTRGGSGLEAAAWMRKTAPAWLSQVVPAADGPAAGLLRDMSQERMRRQLVRFVEALAAIHPVIIFLDDLHWADASTCDLLAYAASRMKDMRVLILTTYRPSELFGTHPFLPVRIALERSGVCREIPLHFLTRGDIECYVNQHFRAKCVSAGVRAPGSRADGGFSPVHEGHVQFSCRSGNPGEPGRLLAFDR